MKPFLIHYPLSVKEVYLFLIISLVLSACTSGKRSNYSDEKQPNIVFLFADDFGNNVPSVNGNKWVSTPHIDAIAKGGVRFRQNYVTAPICCASRAGLLTGRYQQRFGSENHLHYPYNSAYAGDGGLDYLKKLGIDSLDVKTQGIPESELNIAQILKQNGYTTGIIGKWHAGFYDGYRPHQRGFDYSWGWYGGSSLYYTDSSDVNFVTFKDENGLYHHYPSSTGKYQWQRDPIATGIFRNGKLVDEKEYQTFAIAREAEAFLEKNKDKPFFLYVPFGAIHTPLQAVTKDYKQLNKIRDPQQKVLLAMVLGLDEAVGRITQKLKELGLEENTIVVFSGDNGSTYHSLKPGEKGEGKTVYDGTYENLNLPFKGGKLTHYEGGIRTPLFIKWPGKIEPGSVYEHPVSTLDLLPTFVAATKTKLPANRKYDGVDLWPFISGDNPESPHPVLFWRNGFVKTIRKGDYKLLENDRDKTVFLYDLKKDPCEQTDLATQLPAVVNELRHDFAQWEKELSPPRWKSPKVTEILVDGKLVSFQP
ncbi:sulfatase-like hydrolase/transferase [Xanthocytophaga agilis]|uniref:Sulfatase-like hydrolase/transferase n=1 Tax=Xanthocytophaga agilis TaxID=3048010 RepID=A0AAE3R626_9BACT|nr:sulfatase-like hydrolase/transferase [Xanthocytophaga agilis]MDJ1501352.1 sulfatase-like hydrolase/transferase [Xanthocytophaga agilis]